MVNFTTCSLNSNDEHVKMTIIWLFKPQISTFIGNNAGVIVVLHFVPDMTSW